MLVADIRERGAQARYRALGKGHNLAQSKCAYAFSTAAIIRRWARRSRLWSRSAFSSSHPG